MVRGREGAEHGLGVRKKGRQPMDILLMLMIPDTDSLQGGGTTASKECRGSL